MKLLVAFLFAIISAEKARFDNYQVYTLYVENQGQLDTLKYIEDHPDGYLLWNDAHLNRSVDIMVPPHKFADFNEMIAELNIESNLKIKNVQDLIDAEMPEGQTRNGRAFNWISYQTYDEINAWLDQILFDHSHVLSNVEVGTSFQGRPIRAVKYSEGPNHPIIFIEANIHAREWVTSATATWVINNLIYATDAATRDIASRYDFYIIPVANPDGFVYTHTTSRLWRKTRQPWSILCTGTDPNRNFGFNWMQGGASNNPCSDTYAGPHAFSEPETYAISQLYETIASNVIIYLSFHSYGQYILLPYGHSTAQSWNHANLMNFAASGASAISQRYGTQYTYGSIATTLYVASGGSSDWAFGIYGTPYAASFEFRDTGSNGFILPPAQIIPNALEVWDGVLAMVKATQ